MFTKTVWSPSDGTLAGIEATCSCGGWSASRPWQAIANTLTRAHRDHQREAARDERETQRADALAWHARTGHCADCGQPGDWCQCVHPCRCQSAHPTGSGIGRDPAELYADTVPDEQEVLW